MIVISYATIGNYKFLPTKINSKDNTRLKNVRHDIFNIDHVVRTFLVSKGSFFGQKFTKKKLKT